jgi:hypothetical protein
LGEVGTHFQNAIHLAESVPIVDAEQELIEIDREILLGDFMEHAHDPALDQRPDDQNAWFRMLLIVGEKGMVVNQTLRGSSNTGFREFRLL